jgi:hypothetical protein
MPRPAVKGSGKMVELLERDGAASTQTAIRDLEDGL